MTVAALALSLAVLSVAEPARPNLVVLLCDDLGYGDLGCFGHPRIRTPNLDALARDGVRLTAFYAGAPVCSPSRAALFTGRNPNRVGIRDWIPQDSGIHLPRGEVTLPRLLQQAGYTTCLSGKWHLNSKFDGKETNPGDFGFDHWFATQNNTDHSAPKNFVRNGKRAGPLAAHASQVVVDEAIDFIGKAGDRPFAVFVTFHAPHEIIETPEAYRAMYADEADPTVRDYYGSVSLVDHEVGRLLATLDANNLREKTLVLFTSDNGPEGLKRYPKAVHSHGSAGPLRGQKLSMYEGGIRVPGIVRWPGRVRAGTVSDEPVAFFDLLPTLCAATGTPVPDHLGLDGVDARAALEGKAVERPRPLAWQYDRAIGGPPWTLAVRQGPWKLLADAGMREFALYDLVEDPAERRDRASDRPDLVEALKRGLQSAQLPVAP
ncbi:sulfatase family protein [Tundrisphaera sp. TA3]|uniref:sulfatase family protein n=1 Tax=Tundrisphaera sp. TA3 TaxID=3435775 RepID=UPI003EB7370F